MKKGKIGYLVVSIFAAMTSWFLNHSVLWAIIHYTIGPIYLIYSLFTGIFSDGGLMNIINYYF